MLDVLANNLLIIRKTKRVTQKEVAEAVGITATALSAYEKAQREPSLSVIVKLADYYGVSLDWLCGHKSTNEPTTVSRADFLRFLSFVYEEMRYKPNVSDLQVKLSTDVNSVSSTEFSGLARYYKHYYGKETRGTLVSKITLEFSSLDNWMWSYFQAFTDLLEVQSNNALSIDVVTPWKNSALTEYENFPLFKPATIEED